MRRLRLAAEQDVEKKIVEFFTKNPKPSDKDVHAFSETEGIDTHKFEEIIYSLLGSFLGEGRFVKNPVEIDPDALAKGVKVEMEHTTNALLAEKIAKDHLAEMPDYYDKLAAMEKG